MLSKGHDAPYLFIQIFFQDGKNFDNAGKIQFRTE
jgi:hypothetical protein